MSENNKINILDSEFPVQAWGIKSSLDKHEPLIIPRGKISDKFVQIDVIQTGICHSDVHIGLNQWGGCRQPFVAGHEIFGIVSDIGQQVTKFKKGDKIGVGCIVDSCKDCVMCIDNEENYCMKGLTGTQNGVRRHGRVPGNPDLQTFGGYSSIHVVHEDQGIRIPAGIPDQNIAPILCAGVTMWTPLVSHGCQQPNSSPQVSMKVGIVGIGGLGTMGLKLASAMGHSTIAFTRSRNKVQVCLDKGAKHVCVTSEVESVKEQAMQCDLIIDTVSFQHDLQPYLACLKKKGVLHSIGGVSQPMQQSQLQCMFNNLTLTGSVIGGIKATEECVAFCANMGIYPDVQIINAKDIDDVWLSLNSGNNDTGVRYVIDIKESLKNQDFISEKI